MDKQTIFPLASASVVQIAGSNAARRGIKVEPLGTSSPVVTVTVRPWATIPASNVDEIQTITFGAVPTAGTFKLEYNGNKTTALNYNASAGTIQTALRLLAGLGACTVSGTTATSIAITLAGAQVPSPLIHLTDSTLIISAVADVQTLSFSAVPEIGTFRLKMVDNSDPVVPVVFLSWPLVFDISAATLQATLRGLFGDAGMTVTGNFTDGFVISAVNKAGLFNLISVEDSTLHTFTNEVQRVTFTPAPTAGTYKLSFKGVETAAIAFDATATNIRDALRAVTGLEAVTVSGTAATHFDVTFAGLAENAPLLSVTANGAVVAGSAEIQVVSFSGGTANAGAFKLSYGGNTTGSLAFDASAGAVQTALRLLAGLSAVTVSGSMGAGYTVTFTGLNANIALMTVVENTVNVAAITEVQKIAFSSVPDEGSFRIKYGTPQTGLIPYNTDAANVQAELRTILALAAVTVAGNFTSGFTITFTGVSGDATAVTVANNTLKTLTVASTPTITTETAGVAQVNLTSGVVQDTAGVADTACSAAVTTQTAGADGAACTASVAHTTPGAAAINCVAASAVTTPGANTNIGYRIAQGAILDLSNTNPQGVVYAKADAAVSIQVTEVF